MFNVEKQNNAHWVHCEINGAPEIIKFSPYRITSERCEYRLEQEYGLNEEGEFSKQFIPFAQTSTESLLLKFVETGDVDSLTEAGLILCDRPSKGNISRNLGVFDPATGLIYFVGGVGLIKPTDDNKHFVLTDPLLDDLYGEYQNERGNPAGGTQWFSDQGMKGSVNKSIVGTLEYNTGLYHAVRKSLENEKLKKLGINCPDFIAAGKILNFEDGKFGFTIYRSKLTPEYMLNLGLYLNQRGQFKKNFQDYLESKYQQLFKLHQEIKESHGQPSLTNTLCEIDLASSDQNIQCQIKDFETNQPIPTNTKLVIEEGISTQLTGWFSKKSPHAGAQLYDLQHALIQELNVIVLHVRAIQHPQQKFEFIANQCAQILLLVSQYYPICDTDKAKVSIQFAIDTFVRVLKKTNNFGVYNEVIAGAFTHKLFALSERFADQVKLVKE